MNTKYFISELATRPACTLTSIEQYVFNEYCRMHTDEVASMLKAQHPQADLSFLNAKPLTNERKSPSGKELVFGLKGLAEILGCSRVTASRLKTSGKLDKCCTQYGRKLVFDKNAVLELAHTKGGACHA